MLIIERNLQIFFIYGVAALSRYMNTRRRYVALSIVPLLDDSWVFVVEKQLEH